MYYLHFVTSIVTAVLSVYLLIKNGLTCHPVGIVCYVALFIIAYEQFRPVAGKFIDWALDGFNAEVEKEKKQIIDDFTSIEDEDIII